MARSKDKFYMPMGTGGLLRYSEEEKQVFKVKPEHVIIIVAVLSVMEVVLKFLFSA